MAKVKGTVLIPPVKVLRANRERVIDALAPPMRRYLDERILPSSWYPATDHVKLVRVLVPLMPPGQDPYCFMGSAAAQMDLTGIYRAQLRVGDPEKTLRNFTALWRNYCDTGEITLDVDSDHSGHITVRNFDGVSREMCGIIGGYIQGLVMVAGGKNATMRKVKCRLDGAPACVWTISWSR
jgi:hypothetical protein